MIYRKLFYTEQKIKKNLKAEVKRLKALNRIKTLLENLDPEFEVMPATDADKLLSAVAELKNKSLSKYEKIVIQEMFNNKKN